MESKITHWAYLGYDDSAIVIAHDVSQQVECKIYFLGIRFLGAVSLADWLNFLHNQINHLVQQRHCVWRFAWSCSRLFCGQNQRMRG